MDEKEKEKASTFLRKAQKLFSEMSLSNYGIKFFVVAYDKEDWIEAGFGCRACTGKFLLLEVAPELSKAKHVGDIKPEYPSIN